MKTFSKERVSLIHRQVVNAVGKGFFLPYQDHDLFCPCDSGVDEISLQHDEMGHHDGHDDDGIFRAL